VTVDGEDVEEDVTLTHVGANASLLSIISVYPNPFSTSITLNNVGKANRLVISNLIGQRVMDIQFNGSERETINTESLPSGIYMVTILANDNSKLVWKMVKE